MFCQKIVSQWNIQPRYCPSVRYSAMKLSPRAINAKRLSLRAVLCKETVSWRNGQIRDNLSGQNFAKRLSLWEIFPIETLYEGNIQLRDRLSGRYTRKRLSLWAGKNVSQLEVRWVQQQVVRSRLNKGLTSANTIRETLLHSFHFSYPPQFLIHSFFSPPFHPLHIHSSSSHPFLIHSS
jgi:hypothetical protein